MACALLDGTRAVSHEAAPAFFADFKTLCFIPNFSQEPVDEIDDLKALVAGRLQANPDDCAAVMAAILLQPAYMWPNTGDMRRLPTWLIESYAWWRILTPRAFEALGQVDAYADYLRATLNELTVAHETYALEPDGMIALGNAVYNKWAFLQLYFTSSSVKDSAVLKSRLIERHLLRSNVALSWIFPDRKRGTKIRVALYSGQQIASPEGCFLVSHMENFPRDRYELVLFYHSDVPSAFQSFCFTLFDKVILLKESLEDNIVLIRAQNLDVLAFANNLTAISNFLTVYGTSRLARTQIVLSASPMTSGYTPSDVFITAPLNESVQPGRETHSEEVYAIPGMVNYFAFQHDREAQTATFTRESLGVPEGAVLFLSLANYYKTIPELAETWVQILEAVPGSVLLLVPFGPAWGQYEIRPFVKNFTARFAERNISLSRLLIQFPVPSRADILALTKVADVYLDSYPFSGSCSLLDPLLACIPIVAREGQTFRSRFAGTMLRFANLGDLVTDSAEAYKNAAIRLAGAPEERAAIRQRMQAAFADEFPYFNVHTLSRRVEKAFADLSSAYEARLQGLRQMPQAMLKTAITELSATLRAEKNHFWAELHSVEFIRLLALTLESETIHKALHFQLPLPAITNLKSRFWDVTALQDFNGREAIDFAYFQLPHSEFFGLETLGMVRPALIMIDLRGDGSKASYEARIKTMAEGGYDFMIVTFQNDLRVPFVEIDNRITGIHFDIPEAPAEIALMVFFRHDDGLLVKLVELLDRFRLGQDREAMRLVADGQYQEAMEAPGGLLPAQAISATGA